MTDTSALSCTQGTPLILRSSDVGEWLSVELNDETLVHVSYDAHGSGALRAVQQLVEKLSEKFGIALLEVDDDGQDDKQEDD